MSNRWVPKDGETLGDDGVTWDEIEEYMLIQREVESLCARHMVKNKKAGDNFYRDKGVLFSKLVHKYGDLWDVWDAYERKEDIFAGLD